MTRITTLSAAAILGALLAGQPAQACCGGGVPVTASYAPAYTSYYAPAVTTAYYAPTVTSYYAPATTAYYAPAATTAYYAPAVTTSYYAPAATTAYYPTAYTAYSPVTTAYYAPTATYAVPTVTYRPRIFGGGYRATINAARPTYVTNYAPVPSVSYYAPTTCCQ